MVGQFVGMYLTHLRAEGVTANTIQWHTACLKRYQEWLKDEGHSDKPAEWSAPFLRCYIVFLQGQTGKKGKPFSPHAVQSYIRSLRAFCQWLADEEFLDANPMAKVKQPKAPSTVKPVLNKEDIAALLKAAKAGRTVLRDTALILFMLDTGVRASEICTLAITDVAWEHRLAKVFGKGQKERFVPFSPQTAKAMQKYAMKERSSAGESFFVAEEGTQLTASGLYQLCQRLGERANVPLNPHKFRHTFCTVSLRNGASVFTVQRIMGHTTLDVTQRYAALVAGDLATDHARTSPLTTLVAGKR